MVMMLGNTGQPQVLQTVLSNFTRVSAAYATAHATRVCSPDDHQRQHQTNAWASSASCKIVFFGPPLSKRQLPWRGDPLGMENITAGDKYPVTGGYGRAEEAKDN